MVLPYVHSLRSFVVTAVLAAVACCAQVSHAQDFSAQMVGGTFTDLRRSGVVLILSSNLRCSGVLVGRREVLTAAHCIVSAAQGFTVLIGNRWYRSAKAWSHGSFTRELVPPEAARYDLGLIELSADVTDVEPIPVLTEDPIEVGDSLRIAGYGRNESSGYIERLPHENGKIGQFFVTETRSGIIFSEHVTGGASSCPGDSGGPALIGEGSDVAVVGIVSAGTNKVLDGSCYVSGRGMFAFADLQSVPSRDFLSYFPGIQYQSAKSFTVNATATNIVSDLGKLGREKNLKRYKQRVSLHRNAVFSAVRYVRGERRALLISAFGQLRKASIARSLKAARKATKAAVVKLRRFIAIRGE